jgi:tellurite resistance protein TehA-like permease
MGVGCASFAKLFREWSGPKLSAHLSDLQSYDVARLADVLWVFSAILLAVLIMVYLLQWKTHAVYIKAEFYHPDKTYLFMAPAITLSLLLASAPPDLQFTDGWVGMWALDFAYQCVLGVNMYGNFMDNGHQRLDSVAPVSFMAGVNWFLLSISIADYGWIEVARCCFAFGFIIEALLFVSVVQNFAGLDDSRKWMPTLLFFFPPLSSASIASLHLNNLEFDWLSRGFYFASLLLLPVILRLGLRKTWNRRATLPWASLWGCTFPVNGFVLNSAVYAGLEGTKHSVRVAVVLTGGATLLMVFIAVTSIRAALPVCRLFIQTAELKKGATYEKHWRESEL